MKIGVIMYQTSLTKGQELVAQRMTRAFRKLDVEAYLITSPYHDGKRLVAEEVFEKSILGYVRDDRDPFVPIVRVDGYVSSWPPRRIMLRNFVDVLRKIVGELDLDVLVTHSTLWNGPEETAKFVLWKRTMRELGLEEKRIIHCHMPHYQPPDTSTYRVGERSYRLAWNRLVFPQIFRTTNLILVTTPLAWQHMLKMGAREDQYHLFPGGVDEELFSEYDKIDPETFRQRYKIPESKKLITYVGTIEERKNVLAVARVARKLRAREDIHFVIAGKPSNQELGLKNEIRDLENVSFLGEISDVAKVQLIKSSYLNILMSRVEALGLTQLEFMYGEVPIVTSAAGGQRWLVRDDLDGIHVSGPNDIDGAARAIEDLARNQGKRDLMAENARRRAQEFTLGVLIKNLHARLQDLLAS